MNANGIQLYEALNPCLHIGDASVSSVIFFSQKKYFRDFMSSFGNTKASFILPSFLTKFDRFAVNNQIVK